MNARVRLGSIVAIIQQGLRMRQYHSTRPHAYLVTKHKPWVFAKYTRIHVQQCSVLKLFWHTFFKVFWHTWVFHKILFTKNTDKWRDDVESSCPSEARTAALQIWLTTISGMSRILHNVHWLAGLQQRLHVYHGIFLCQWLAKSEPMPLRAPHLDMSMAMNRRPYDGPYPRILIWRLAILRAEERCTARLL
jgi:hypothetical protein